MLSVQLAFNERVAFAQVPQSTRQTGSGYRFFFNEKNTHSFPPIRDMLHFIIHAADRNIGRSNFF